MADREFVAFDSFGTEVDSVDPYESHRPLGLAYEVTQESGRTYTVIVPEGGRYEIREMEADDGE